MMSAGSREGMFDAVIVSIINIVIVSAGSREGMFNAVIVNIMNIVIMSAGSREGMFDAVIVNDNLENSTAALEKILDNIMTTE